MSPVWTAPVSTVRVKGEKDDDADKDRWKADAWLPRALAAELDYAQPDPVCEGGLMEGHDWTEEDGLRTKCRNCGGHFWWVALREYAPELFVLAGQQANRWLQVCALSSRCACGQMSRSLRRAVGCVRGCACLPRNPHRSRP